jgi:hypothetical protein
MEIPKLKIRSEHIEATPRRLKLSWTLSDEICFLAMDAPPPSTYQKIMRLMRRLLWAAHDALLIPRDKWIDVEDCHGRG